MFPKNSAFDPEAGTTSVVAYESSPQVQINDPPTAATVPYSTLEDWVYRLREGSYGTLASADEFADQLADEIETYLRG